jgi:citronellyl-CoA dehydrogenase
VARKDGDDYVITGQKMWITNSLQADWMCMLVNTGEGPQHKNKSLVMVPMRDGPNGKLHQGHLGRAEDQEDRHELQRHRSDLL